MKTSLRLAPHLKLSTTVILIANPKRWTLKQFSQSVCRLLDICKKDIIAKDSSISPPEAWQSARGYPITKLCDLADPLSVNTDTVRVLKMHQHLQSQTAFSYSPLQDRYGCPSSEVILTVAEFLSENSSLASRCRRDQSETALLPPLKLPTSVLHRPCSCTPASCFSASLWSHCQQTLFFWGALIHQCSALLPRHDPAIVDSSS